MMAKAEFKNKYGITFSAVAKKINEMYSEMNKEVGHYVETLERVNKCEGHGVFSPTGETRMRLTFVVDKEATANKKAEYKEAIQDYLAQFNGDYERIAEAKKNEAKAKRYMKEIEEMEAIIAYKKAWLAKNWA